MSPEQCQSHKGPLDKLPAVSALEAGTVTVTAETYTPATNGLTCPNWIVSAGEDDDVAMEAMLQSRLKQQQEMELVMDREMATYHRMHGYVDGAVYVNVGVAVITFLVTAVMMYCWFNYGKQKEDMNELKPLLV